MGITTETAAARTAKNVQQLRKLRGLTVRDLSARLAEVGHPVGPSGVSKIELAQRRIDVEDLLALAAALQVSPNRLLLAPGASETEPLALTESVEVSEGSAWRWAVGERPLSTAVPEDDYRFATENRPHDPVKRLTIDELVELRDSGNLDTLSAGYHEAREAGVSYDTIRAYLWEVRRAEYLNSLRAKKTED